MNEKDVGKVEFYLTRDKRKPWHVMMYTHEGEPIGEKLSMAPSSPIGSIVWGLVRYFFNHILYPGYVRE